MLRAWTRIQNRIEAASLRAGEIGFYGFVYMSHNKTPIAPTMAAIWDALSNERVGVDDMVYLVVDIFMPKRQVKK